MGLSKNDFFEITGKQSVLFPSLDPYGISALSGMGDVHTFIITEALLGGDEAVGIATVEFGEDEAVIYWLYVHTKYRSQGIGESFLKKICELAKERGSSEVSVRIPQLAEMEEFPLNIEYYFYERGFVKEDTTYFEFWIDAEMLSDLGARNDTDAADVIALERLSGQKITEFAKEISMHFGMSPASTRIDKKVSCVCLDDKGNPNAMVLFVKNSNTWFLIGSFARNKESAARVLGYALGNIAEQIVVKESVWLSGIGENFARAGEQLFGDIKAGETESMRITLTES